jgi:hypothetical protein
LSLWVAAAAVLVAMEAPLSKEAGAAVWDIKITYQ